MDPDEPQSLLNLCIVLSFPSGLSLANISSFTHTHTHTHTRTHTHKQDVTFPEFTDRVFARPLQVAVRPFPHVSRH